MLKVGKADTKDRGRKPVIVPVLQCGDTGSPVVQVGFVGIIRRDDEGGGGYLCGVTTLDHRELGEASRIWGMGDISGGVSSMVMRDAVGGLLHMPLTGRIGAVGGSTPTSGVLHAEDRISGERKEEKTLVDIGSYRVGAEAQSGRGNQGGPTGTTRQGCGRRQLGIMQALDG